MSYADKCCGICDEYVEYNYETNRRFRVANICDDCITSKVLSDHSVSDVTTHKCIENNWIAPRHGFVWNLDTDGVFRRYHKSRFEEFYKKSIDKPWLFEVKLDSMCIYSSDKRKLRKALRKAGLKGKISGIF